MSKAALETKLRNDCLGLIAETLENQYDSDVLPISSSEIAIPVVDEEGNEKFLLIKVSVPRGTRNGEGGYDPYDGYAVSEAYKLEQESKTQEKAVKKAMRDAEKAKKKKEEE